MECETVSGSTYATTYYTFDLRGNTANRVDQNANVVTSASCNAYGAKVSSTLATLSYGDSGAKE